MKGKQEAKVQSISEQELSNNELQGSLAYQEKNSASVCRIVSVSSINYSVHCGFE